MLRNNNKETYVLFKADAKGLMNQIISVLDFYLVVPNIWFFTLVQH